MHDEQLYRHSGRFSVSGLLIGFLVTAVIGIALSFVYAYALKYIPFVYINVLLTLGFGFVLGLIALKFVIQFKIRNGMMGLVMTFLAVLASYYAAWIVWMAAHLRSAGIDVSMVAMAKNPAAVWDLIQAFNRHGTWSLGRHSSENVTGIFLAVIWVAEAAMIFGAALLTVAGTLKTPFCEACESWCEERKGIAAVGARMADLLRERVLGKDWAALAQAGLERAQVGTWCTLDLHTCPSCGQTNTLTLNSVTVTTNKKGEAKTQTTVLINRLLLTANETQTLLAACDRLKAPAVQQASAPSAGETDQAESTESETV